MSSGGSGPGVGGGSYAGGEGWGPTMGGGSGYGGDLGGLGTAGTMSGGAGGAGMSGYGGGGRAGMVGSGWGGGGGLAGANARAAPGTSGYSYTTTYPGVPKPGTPGYVAPAPGWHTVTVQGPYQPGFGPTFTTSYVKDSTPPIGGVTSPGMPGGISPGGFAVNAGGFNPVGNTNTGIAARAPSLGDRNLGSLVGGTGGSMTTGGAQGGGLNRTGTSAGRF